MLAVPGHQGGKGRRVVRYNFFAPISGSPVCFCVRVHLLNSSALGFLTYEVHEICRLHVSAYWVASIPIIMG